MLRIDVLKTPPIQLDAGPRLEEVQPPEAPVKGLKLFSAVTGSTWRSNDRRAHRPRETTDVFHCALSPQGLPMGAFVEGYDEEKDVQNTQVQITTHLLMSLLDRMTQEVDGRLLPDEQVIARLKAEYLQLDTGNPGQSGKFVFSALLIFKDAQGQLKALSFGMGNTLLALDKHHAVETVVAARDLVSNQSCPQTGAPVEERPLNQLEVDLRTVSQHDRFIFFSHEAHRHAQTQVEKIASNDPAKKIWRTTLKTLPGEEKEAESPSHVEAPYIRPGFNTAVFSRQIDVADQAIFTQFSNRATLSVGTGLTLAELTIPTPEQQAALQAFLFDKALEKLNETLEPTLAPAELPKPVKDKFLLVRDKIQKMRALPSPDLPALTKALLKTDHVIQQRTDTSVVNEYITYANKEIRNKSSVWWKALGRAMQAAGALLALFGGLILAGTLGGGAAAGAPLLGLGLGLAGLGQGFFRKGQNKDLQGDMIAAGRSLKPA